MKKLRAMFILCLFSSMSFAYEGSPESQVDQFFKELSAGKIKESIDNLYASNPAMQQKIQALVVLKQQLSMIGPLFGEFIGHENVHHEKMGESVVRIVQIAKYEMHPVVWEFYFYKPKDKWIISQAMYVDQFQTIGAKK